MPTRSVADAERQFLMQVLGVSVGQIDDLRLKFYEGVINGTVVLGAGDRAKYGSGQFIGPRFVGSNGSQSQGINFMRAIPIDIEGACTLSAIGTNCLTAGSAGAVIRMGIYDDVAGLPANRLVDAGTIITTVTGIRELPITLAVSAKRYWLIGCTQVAAANFPDMTNAIRLGNVPSNSIAQGTSDVAGYFNTAGGVTGALPATFGAVSENVATGLIRMYVKVA